MSWSNLPPPSSSTLELQEPGRGDTHPLQIPSQSMFLAALAGIRCSVHQLALSWMDLILAGGNPNKFSSIIGPYLRAGQGSCMCPIVLTGHPLMYSSLSRHWENHLALHHFSGEECNPKRPQEEDKQKHPPK